MTNHYRIGRGTLLDLLLAIPYFRLVLSIIKAKVWLFRKFIGISNNFLKIQIKEYCHISNNKRNLPDIQVKSPKSSLL